MGNFARVHLIWYYNNRKGMLPLKLNPLKVPGCKCAKSFKNSFQRKVLEKTEHPEHYDEVDHMGNIFQVQLCQCSEDTAVVIMPPSHFQQNLASVLVL